MWARLITRLVIALLKWARLSIEDRTLLTVAMIDKLKALPVSDIISLDQKGSLLIEGKPVELNQAISLREGARLIVNSPTYRIVQAQILYQATKLGIHEGDTPEKVFFSKVAIWWHQEQKALYESFAQQTTQDEDMT